MKKKLPILVICLAVVLVICIAVAVILVVNSNNTPEETTPPTTVPVTTAAPTTAPTTEPTTAPTTEPTEPPVLYRNPLTGEPLDAPCMNRLFTSTINDVPAALPMVGVQDADLFFEVLVNGGATRGLAMYTDVTKVEKIGSIRSARYPFVDICEAYDAIFAHAGGSAYVMNKIYNCGIDNLPDNGNYYYRDSDRMGAGYDWEHCLVVNGTDMLQYAKDMEYRTTTETEMDYGLHFTEGAVPNGETANTIDFQLWSNTRQMVFNETTKTYDFWQYGRESMEAFTEQQVNFKNVLLLQMNVYTDENNYHISALDGTGNGYYACNGKIVPIIWHHEDEYTPFTFTLEDGTPLEMDIGNSYIGFIPDEDPITWG